MNVHAAITFPRCTATETHILQLRAQGMNYRAVSAQTGIAPRKVHDMEKAAMKRVVEYLTQQAFLKL